MKALTLAPVVLGLLLSTSAALAGRPEDPGANLTTYANCRSEKRAVVVGSSVTLGFFGDSPSVLYLERAGFSRKCILKKSFPIGDSASLLGWLKNSVEDFKPEIIVGLDYLIHDVTFVHDENNVAPRLVESNATIDYLKSTNLPVVIGTVFTPRPVQYPYQIGLAKSINERLCAEAAAAPQKFFVLPIARIYRELYSSEFTVPQTDHVFAKGEVLVDMYHPGPRGAYLLTNRLIDVLNRLHESGAFAYSVKPFKQDDVMNEPKTRPMLQSLNPMAHEKTLFTKHGEDTIESVDESTIPDSAEARGDEGCTAL